ncbi:AbrB/MazE/SpoVT family DNA-binding domain-containing protein [uncultured Devosia sp.]|uniref:AbrB/MazE/SpoVT family DNA-binding domain-containing protein n=1 Tax=uncultured Devosia sp. TaxID=211434 RepID=UPI0035CA4D31
MNEHLQICARSKMTSKGQTTVPREIRDALGLAEGVQIEWVVNQADGTATIKPRTLRAVDLAGFLGPSPVGPVSIEQMNEGIAEAVAERFARAVKR